MAGQQLSTYIILTSHEIIRIVLVDQYDVICETRTQRGGRRKRNRQGGGNLDGESQHLLFLSLL